MADIDYDISASECSNCKKAVLVPASAPAPHCWSCGRQVEGADPNRYSNLNATMQRLASFARESKVFDKANTNTSMARLGIEEIGRFMIDFLVINEASIRYGYYGKPGEYEQKVLARTRAFLDELEIAYREAAAEVATASKA